MAVNYDHALNRHTLSGPQAAIPLIFEGFPVTSLLDVGCGTGTWLRAAIDYGISDVAGIDGVAIDPDKLHFPVDRFSLKDFTTAWSLNRVFDAAICLEVAEHLASSHASDLIEALTRHAKVIFFSAACPGQPGQNHMNCQWPDYWQGLFNHHGFVCDDSVRWKIWPDSRIEWWYRQNLFVARFSPERAGNEPRIRSVVHPECLQHLIDNNANGYKIGKDVGRREGIEDVRRGCLRTREYLLLPFAALSRKAMSRLRKVPTIGCRS